jgi:Major capsid protein
VALADFTYPGAVNDSVVSAGDERALYLKQFAGEVIRAFRTNTVMYDRTMKKRIPNGKSAQFIAYGRADAAFRERGKSILTATDHLGGNTIMQAFNVVERVIGVDDMLTTGTVIDEMDDLLAHYEVRSGFAEELGNALSRKYDEYAFRTLVNCARTTSATEDTFIPADLGSRGDGGYVEAAADWVGDGSITSGVGTEVLDALHEAGKIMDEKEVPRAGRFCALPPTLYWALVRNKEVINRDYGAGDGRNGILAQGTVYVAGGFTLLETAHLPSTELTSAPGGVSTLNVYHHTANSIAGTAGAGTGTLQAICWANRAIGAVELLPPTVQFGLDNVEYQGDIIVAKTMVGFGRLQPESVVEITTASSQPVLP